MTDRGILLDIFNFPTSTEWKLLKKKIFPPGFLLRLSTSFAIFLLQFNRALLETRTQVSKD